VETTAEAVASLTSGMTIAVGGAINVGHPMALVRAVIKAGLHDLTIVSGFGSLDLDVLVGTGCCSRLIAAFAGVEGLSSGLMPCIRWAAETHGLDYWDLDEGMLLAALQARAQQLPFITWRCGLGTDVARNPLVKLATDSVSGLPYLEVRPLAVDACLLWAEAADEHGSILRWGPDFGDEAMANAADLRIVQVESLVPTQALALNPDRVSAWQADVVVVSPLGTFPFASSAIKDDLDWMQEFVSAVTAARKQGAAWEFARDLIADRLHLNGDDHSLLESVGVARLRGLML
jgi:glutaconate CoA-transferase subunit A